VSTITKFPVGSKVTIIHKSCSSSSCVVQGNRGNCCEGAEGFITPEHYVGVTYKDSYGEQKSWCDALGDNDIKIRKETELI
jgi:hypothetical protein